jgi:small basic protein
LLVGLVLGFQLPVMLPLVYTKYMSIAVLAALDSVFGGIRAYMEDSFDYLIFTSGFFVNMLLAAGLAYMGDRLGVELYLAAVIVFGVRLFNNLGIIRRYLLKKH